MATSWRGADPTAWHRADYSTPPTRENQDLIREAMLGAKSARDAAAHRLYYKKALEAQGHPKRPDDEADQRYWCYVWQSDNTSKTRILQRTPDNPYPGKPTIQHGYARGAVALFIQLADITIEKIRGDQGWTDKDSQLPSEWFDQTIPKGPCAGMTLWGGHELWR